jgi:hypothetical protein
MHFRAVTTVGLEGTLGHRSVLIRDSLPCGQVLSIADQTRPFARETLSHLTRLQVSHACCAPIACAVAQACNGSRTCAPLLTSPCVGSLRRRHTHRKDSLRIAPLPLYASLHFCCHATAKQRRPI